MTCRRWQNAWLVSNMTPNTVHACQTQNLSSSIAYLTFHSNSYIQWETSRVRNGLKRYVLLAPEKNAFVLVPETINSFRLSKKSPASTKTPPWKQRVITQRYSSWTCSIGNVDGQIHSSPREWEQYSVIPAFRW